MYGTIIIDDNVQNSISLLDTFKGQLDSSGNVFVLVRNEADAKGNVIHDFFDVIDAADKLGYLYVNTIVAPTDVALSALPDNVLYIVWIAKDKNHFFNKDRIIKKGSIVAIETLHLLLNFMLPIKSNSR